MAQQTVTPPPSPGIRLEDVLHQLGQFRWLRGHISTFAVGSVALLTFNLLLPVGTVWAATVIGVWLVLLVAHGILLVMARLSQELLKEDPPPQLAQWRPVEPAVPKTPPAPEKASGWKQPSGEKTSGKQETSEPERMSWKSATDAAWLTTKPDKDEGTESEGTTNS